MSISFAKDSLLTCCGVDEIGEFAMDDDTDEDFYDDLKHQPSSSGLSLAVFIDTPPCRKAYELLKNKYTILYQSPVCYNRGSGNNLFLVVYMEGK